MKKNTLTENFISAHNQIAKSGIPVKPRDVYLAYCALALCTIADKMTEENKPLFDTDNPGKEKEK